MALWLTCSGRRGFLERLLPRVGQALSEGSKCRLVECRWHLCRGAVVLATVNVQATVSNASGQASLERTEELLAECTHVTHA
jgi:hypothetical protein